jgi:hypothetical protein
VGLDASQLLGAPQIAGVKVNPRGMAKRVAGTGRGVGAGAGGSGILGGTIGSRIASKMQPGAVPSEVPDFGRNAYLALTNRELALIKLRSGLVTLKFDEVLARVSRNEVTAAELGGGVSAVALTITFANGAAWAVEVPRPSKKHAEELVRALGL